jgi:hypothetical protein
MNNRSLYVCDTKLIMSSLVYRWNKLATTVNKSFYNVFLVKFVKTINVKLVLSKSGKIYSQFWK